MKAIAHSYWRRIKDGARSFAAVPKSVQDDVKALAVLDVEAGIITQDQYKRLIGEEDAD
jgi:hypothetical protein